MEGAFVFLSRFDGLLSIFRNQNGIASALQIFTSQYPHATRIFHQQNGLRTAWNVFSPFAQPGSFQRGVDPGQINAKCRTLTWFALYRYMSATLRDDALDYGQAQTGTLPGPFGSEVRLEDVPLRPSIHPNTRVTNREHHVG